MPHKPRLFGSTQVKSNLSSATAQKLKHVPVANSDKTTPDDQLDFINIKQMIALSQLQHPVSAPPQELAKELPQSGSGSVASADKDPEKLHSEEEPAGFRP
ncbi:MAG: hypothetical protein A3F46_08490 [Legionellales bacterium RIFCSPHIGHO2_12_FULL_42_9]|nr:MAG: hypothetical protein A3F46_08490 [Legionellales bacterium RIFCSPHIGHO2_12_FULL_42_9]